MNHSQLDEEFNLRIKHNFKEFVLLTSNSMQWSEGHVLEIIYRLNGYRRHKSIKYGNFISHIHIKFENEKLAKEAIEILNIMNCDLKAALVDDMLKDWFTYEIKGCCGPPYSLTIVDIIGNPPLNLNFLTNDIISTVLQEFGAPYLLPYTAALNEPHVQVLFHSMTEALAACMAFGEWYRLEDKVDCFFYRVRINPCSKEEKLIRNCGGIPAEAFKLDYFVNVRKEPTIEKRYDSTTKEKRSKNKIGLAKGIHKVHNEKCRPIIKLSEFGQINSTRQILHLPIIATNCPNTLTSANQLRMDSTTTSFSLKQNVVVAAPNHEAKKRTQSGNAEKQEYKDKPKQPFNALQNKFGFAAQNYVQARSRGTSKKMTTRIFERRA